MFTQYGDQGEGMEYQMDSCQLIKQLILSGHAASLGFFIGFLNLEGKKKFRIHFFRLPLFLLFLLLRTKYHVRSKRGTSE